MATETKVLEKAPQKQVIVYTGMNMGYLDAREFVREKGGLPSNALHDDAFEKSDDWRKLNEQGYYGAWAREILVYPKKNGRFKRREHVVDKFTDDKGRKWMFPAALIPEAAFEVEWPSLFVNPGNDPKGIEINDKRVVIAAPESIVVLSPSIQASGQIGKVDEATRIPLYVSEDERQYLIDPEKRSLWRMDGAGVRPLVRDYIFCDSRRAIAYGRHNYGFGVGWVRSLARN